MGENNNKATATIIDVRRFNLWYGGFHALKDITIKIPERCVYAFIGPSGCGKSTFLRAFNRMNDIIPGVRTEGEIYFRDYNIYGDEIDVVELRRTIGMVFQKPNPFPKSIYDNIAYGPRVHGVTDRKQLDEIVKNCLKAAALWDEVKDNLNKSALSLSGGQQQRLCIARALAVNPEIMLMDEPTSALDPIATAKIEDLISELKKKYTVIIVTHNMQQAARVSDYTGFFYLGSLVEFGSTEQIFENPEKPETEAYITGRFG